VDLLILYNIRLNELRILLVDDTSEVTSPMIVIIFLLVLSYLGVKPSLLPKETVGKL